MTFRELCTRLQEKPYRVRYWSVLLTKEGLVGEPKHGIPYKYSDAEIVYFEKIAHFLQEGVASAPEAIRLVQNNITPGEALDRYQQSQTEIALLQKKVLQLRKPFWWTVKSWLTTMFSKFKVVKGK